VRKSEDDGAGADAPAEACGSACAASAASASAAAALRLRCARFGALPPSPGPGSVRSACAAVAASLGHE
jgi:hypothetical protein